MPSTIWPTMAPTRSFISRAALLVKVTARISPGRARPVARMWAMRVVSTRVLPVPAPASTSTGPSSVSTASPLLRVEVVEIRRARGRARPRGDAARLAASAATWLSSRGNLPGSAIHSFRIGAGGVMPARAACIAANLTLR